ncbi:MAG TPA: energy transducer TonB [Candidatus Eisenbacteria bacterium]|nr:energy transducer TonB [Candidatus Eisenbacteria bacterium]
MTAATLRLDLEEVRRQTRWTMTLSVAVHALLFLWIVLQPATHHETPPLTEITFLEPGDLEGPPAPAPAAEPSAEARSGAAARSVQEAKFQRLDRSGDISLDPVSPNVVSDRLEARLASLQQMTSVAPAGTGTSVVPAALFGSGNAPIAGMGGGPAVSLTRGGSGGSPVPLTRGVPGGTGIAPATLPSPGHGSGGGTQAADVGDAAARRTVAGASLAGPIADRRVLSTEVPEYPDWAKREAVEGSVTLYFVVRPDGTVKENVVIQKTAGFGDFDDNARTALRAWRFEPLHGGRTGEQWGTITFRFRLRDVG